ncbi:hypothetical protein SAMN04489724_4027 [Algoriphagus locisalis]|uniref:Uncharacterized protein n=1 Tax=Algoriphagus locisalis TaxID=305507 RepID=A0A1I7DG10_9BACT|nr:hypothetical protein [Algoriphagus locisalis]SFU10642.1 hypothetical protein SAMN04489724_4027 [Algoriphagus locisalis]
MKKLLALLVIFISCFQLLSCVENDDLPLADSKVLIDSDAYLSASADGVVINSLDIKGDLLIVNFSASGCNGESWEVKLIDSGALMYSNPPQRKLILSLKNEEVCAAYITKELVFDISELKVQGGRVWLNVTNSDQVILYTF